MPANNIINIIIMAVDIFVSTENNITTSLKDNIQRLVVLSTEILLLTYYFEDIT